MKKIYYILFILSLFLTACGEDNSHEIMNEKNVSIRIAAPRGFSTRTVDADNLAIEQIVNNLSLFLTEPGSTTITEKFIYVGFTNSIDYQTITLPTEPTDLLTKDIYVIANYPDQSTLNSLTTVDELQSLHTPEVDKTNNLNPLDGFCMFGSTPNFDFTDEANYPLIIDMVRSCAKFRMSVSFPNDPTLSTNNSFLIQNAAKYTFVIKNSNTVLPVSDYFTFAAAQPLTDNGSQTYSNNTYLYEATKAPILYIYTHFRTTTEEQEFSVTLPVPQRNYLYDLSIQVYEDDESETRSAEKRSDSTYKIKRTLNVYNEKGEFVEEFSNR